MYITAAELTERLAKGELLYMLDVRSEIEYSTFNIGGINISVGKLPSCLDDLEWDANDEIIVVCTMGLRSTTGQQILQQGGYKNVRNLKGGLIELQKLKQQHG